MHKLRRLFFFIVKKTKKKTTQFIYLFFVYVFHLLAGVISCSVFVLKRHAMDQAGILMARI